ncbi:hypothetical protein SAMN04487895_101697 [Paenibacillus sophorae]|uniref:Uncharacterized protein n=1 Tax=Paenibacillus sophorae TaxID=1333845 RepID=A0A1H8GYU9_9BACL|nr:hypothetical protein [Paenibacillus sophorae]QWU14388.1 hypothetical protein KP014_21000 [Paenibacillus sophorae]SEN49272.1 hypothetical protein SAMN04487895_101697 [Paenibacillus sophorae]
MTGQTTNELFLHKDYPDSRVVVDTGTKFEVLDKGIKASRIKFIEGEFKNYIRIINNDLLIF